MLDELGIDRFHVAGYSLGAVIAAATAAQAGDRVASATLLCGWAVSDPRMIFTFGLWQQLIAVDPALFMRYAVADGFTPGAIGALWDSLEEVVALGAHRDRCPARPPSSISTSPSTSRRSSARSRHPRS